METLLKLTDYIGIRFLVLDAKPEAINFYLKIGFRELKRGEKGTTPMYYDMKGMINQNIKKEKLSSMDISRKFFKSFSQFNIFLARRRVVLFYHVLQNFPFLVKSLKLY